MQRGPGGGRKAKATTIASRLRDRGAGDRTPNGGHFKLPAAPSHLTRAAKAEWRRIGRTLSDAGLLSTLDLTALAMYCDAYAQWLEAKRILQGPLVYCTACDPRLKKGSEGPSPLCTERRHMLVPYGNIVLNRLGQNRPSPYLKIAKDCVAQMTKLLAEFGMTPASRSRIPIAPGGGPAAPVRNAPPAGAQQEDPRTALRQALKVVREHVDKPVPESKKRREKKVAE